MHSSSRANAEHGKNRQPRRDRDRRDDEVDQLYAPPPASLVATPLVAALDVSKRLLKVDDAFNGCDPADVLFQAPTVGRRAWTRHHRNFLTLRIAFGRGEVQ